MGKEGVAFTFSTHIPHLESGVSQVRRPPPSQRPEPLDLQAWAWRKGKGRALAAQLGGMHPKLHPSQPLLASGSNSEALWGRGRSTACPQPRPGICCLASSVSVSFPPFAFVLIRNAPPGSRGQTLGPLCGLRLVSPELPCLPSFQFASLREEKKQEEVKGLIEKDNLLLRQVAEGVLAGSEWTPGGRVRVAGAHSFKAAPCHRWVQM